MGRNKRNFMTSVFALLFVASNFANAVEGPRGYSPGNQQDVVPYSGVGALCEILLPGIYTETDKEASLRDALLYYRMVTNHPMTTGWLTLEMNWDLNLKGGSGKSWGGSTFEPDTYSGTFIEDYSIKARRFVWYVTGTWYGTGDLEGITVDYTSEQVDPSQAPPDICGGTPAIGFETIEGYIYGIDSP